MSFEKIIGNEKAKEELEKLLDNNIIGHSYIFQGPEGVGKVLFATEFAKRILCESGNSCDTCKSCIMFNSSNHPDFMKINNEEENIKIDEIRKFIEKVIEKPIISKNKVYIINAADKMTKEAQNCLLKTLEEPPEFVTIILISSNENMLLTTIKSRCVKIPFLGLTGDEIKKYIRGNDKYSEKDFTDEMIDILEGSLKKLDKIFENKDTYEPIKNLLENTKELDKLDFYLKGHIIYNKDEIYDILEYMISVLYKLGQSDSDYLNGISIIQNTINKLKSNNNFDSMLFEIWEDINDNNNRS